MNMVSLLISTFLACWFGSITIVKTYKGEATPGGNFVLFALGLTGVLAHFYGIY